MKSADKILQEKLDASRNNYMSAMPEVYRPAIIEAMKEYAGQGIERCAEKVALICPKDAPDYIDKQSILSVKSELQ